MSATVTAWEYLNAVFDGPSPHLQEALAAGRTPEEIARGIWHQASWIGPMAGETERRYRTSAQKVVERAATEGFSLIHPETAEWPEHEFTSAFAHADLHADVSSSADPRELTAPHGLWVSGNTNLRALVARSVGIVGTRAATSYGHSVSAELGQNLAGNAYTIVSGGAMGIDTTAHRAALDSNTPTIAVMASGPGFIYPLRNKDLFTSITQRGGALISEYAPGTPAERFRFLVRNRLVAALTQGTVVVEAPYRSGALNTMKRVEDFGRVAMAVPGPITSVASGGCNMLIKSERAIPVTDIRDVHAYLSRIGEVDVEAQLELEFSPSPVQQLSRNELRVFDVLPVEGSGTLTAEEVASKAGLSIGLTVHVLVDIAKRGLVVREGTSWSKVEDYTHAT